MKIKSLEDIIQELETKSNEKDNIIHDDSFEKWLKEQKEER